MASGLVTNLTKRAHVGHGFGESRRMPAEPPERCPECRAVLVVADSSRWCPSERIAHYVWATMPALGLNERHQLQQGALASSISSEPQAPDSL